MTKRLLLLLLVLFPLAVLGHETRPAYLEMREVAPGAFSVLWKTPMRGEMRLALVPELSGRTETVTPVETRETNGAAVQTWQFRVTDSLRGRSLRIQGLETTMTDALARIEFADGSALLQRLTPQAPELVIPRTQTAWSVAGTYLELGIEHILLGIDHLLFVLSLLLIARGTWGLLKAVTAFTVAHSITLALAALGYVHVPQAPVEAVIALSIVFVASEIVHARRGRDGIAARATWVIAFTFGLLHGLGFAGALAQVGLPERHVPFALLFFNVGVETGQLLFIAVVLVLMGLLRGSRVRFPSWAISAPPYAIGSAAMFWVLQRVAAF